MNNSKDQLIYTSNNHFDKEKLNYFFQLVEDSLQNELFPGLEIMLFRGKEVLFHKVFGSKSLNPTVEPLQLNTIFDVASMTKPMITALLTMILVEQGKLNLCDAISLFYPEYRNDKKKLVTIKHLLTHTSGLSAWANLYENMKSKDQSMNKLLSFPLEYDPGTQMIYSCLGFILLKMIIEKVTSFSIDQLAKNWIFSPLEMKDSYFNPPKEVWERIPPTGECSWRKKIILGEVHDENSYFLEGLGGNAGLFSTAQDIAIFSNMLLQKGIWNNKTILSPQSIELMTRNHFEMLPPRGLGFNLKARDHKPCGELFSQYSFGHTGFTGTSFWIDSKISIGIILLSNRVHITYKENVEAMKTFRMKAHNILLSALKLD